MVDANTFKSRLEERLAALVSKLSEIDEDLKEHGTEADFEERATEVAGDEVLEGLGIQGLKEAQQIKAALTRIEEGTFGLCVQCDEKIPEKRLELLPHTPLCTSCMSGAE
ncbi:MAG: TraR/DksA C4-type zinc finger protein [Pseudomonadota bacterium]|jgi:RNA polymerase-binding transcription factor DksA|nr:TraR/DksA C4-type zinc finger protein [Pseudomonadota bacterium]|tara:strand:- start:203 stop:532 length:330 start_codon:yes stop_codon:yes gene_type:complete